MSQRIKNWLGRAMRTSAATENFPWFRAGYSAALDDIEAGDGPVSGPWSAKERREAADAALQRWIEGAR